MYDYLIVGAGLFGATFAQQAHDAGKSVLVIDKRPQIAGNIYTEKIEGINVHKYGAHIFHTNNRQVWEYLGRFAEFNRFTNSPIRGDQSRHTAEHPFPNFRGLLCELPCHAHHYAPVQNRHKEEKHFVENLSFITQNRKTK